MTRQNFIIEHNFIIIFKIKYFFVIFYVRNIVSKTYLIRYFIN